MGKMRLTANILFAGIGCQERGLENTGVIDLDVLSIAEIDRNAILSYAAMQKGLTEKMIAGYDAYPDMEKMIQELRDKNIGYDAKNGKTFDWNTIRKDREYIIKKHWLATHLSRNLGDISRIHALPEADLWTISFPCQDISIAGKRKGFKMGSGTRSSLLWEQIRLLETAVREKTAPRFLLFENVAQLVGKKFWADFSELLAQLDELGYQSVWKVLDAKDCGIPQHRERVFVVCIRKDIHMDALTFPEPYECDVKLESILDPAAGRNISMNMGRLESIVTMLGESGGCTDRCEEPYMDMTGKEVMGMENKNVTDGKKNGTYKAGKLTPEMCFQLMGLTVDDARKCRALGIPDTQLCRQAGNGIVTNCIQLIGEHLYKALEVHEFVCTDERRNKMHEDVISLSDAGAGHEGMKLGDLAAEIGEALHSMQQSYLKIGWILKKIKEAALYKEESFRSIYGFARHYFNLPQSAVSRFIKIFEEFSVGDRPQLQERYKEYNFSQLAELLPMKKELRDQVTPEMSVAQIRKLKRAGAEARKAKSEAGADAGNVPYSVQQGGGYSLSSVTTEKQLGLPKISTDDERRAWIRNFEIWGLWYTDPNIQTEYYKYDFKDGSRLVAAKYKSEESSDCGTCGDDIHYHMVFSDRFFEKHRDGYLAGYKNTCIYCATPMEFIMSFLRELDEEAEAVDAGDEVTETDGGYICNGYVMEDFDQEEPGKAESFIGKKYEQFYGKYGYIPRYFNAKNCREADGCAMTLCTSSGSATGIGSIIIFDAEREAVAVINNKDIDTRTACRKISKICCVARPEEREKVRKLLKSAKIPALRCGSG